MNGECDMMKYYSIGMKLNDVIKEPDFERLVLENVRQCSRCVGKMFRVVFWHVNLTEQECKDFVKRNEHLLFEVNTKITKDFRDAWFVIDSRNEKSSARYRYEGDILEGIVEYIKIINHMNKRDNR